MGKLSEFKGAEKPVIEWLSKMGWQYIPNSQLKKYNRPFSVPVIEDILLNKVQKINNVSKDVAQIAVDQLLHILNNPSPILGNEQFLNRIAKTSTIAYEGDDIEIAFIDFKNIWKNDFIVTNQYWVQGYKMVKTDIMLLVNGLPLIPIEAKQRARKGTNWVEGVKQFSTYHQRAEKLFMCHCFGVACNGRITKFGVPGASQSYFGEWKNTVIDTSSTNPILDSKNDLCEVERKDDGYFHFKVQTLPNGEVLEKMKLGIIGLLQPARVLDILKNFIVFERNESKVIKKVARYQQLRAANKIVERVRDTDLKQGVIWHTQGSGKSLTMLYTAQKLTQEEKLKDPTIYIVVDRKDLREQIGGTFDDCEFPNARPVNNIGDLKYIIEKAPSGVYITTIQKFRELGDAKDVRDNVIILIDEAHRTQYGDFQIELQKALPNARRFAFTGTPIPKTHKEFGIKKEEGHEYYLDKYGIKDAIDDGATKKIRYTFGPQEWFLDKEKLKKGYEEITADLTEDEKKLVERKVQPWKVFLKHPERVDVLAEDIAKDFRETVEPQGFKAQIVACDKEACVKYYDTLMGYFDPSEVAVIFSTGHYEDDEKYQLFEPHYKEDKERKRLIKNFKKPITKAELEKGNNLKILIVCNMLLTGFDAPIEQTMYLDSPIRDHNLLQAVARTNRPYDNKITGLSKEFGRIVDYVGVFTNYTEALNYDPEDIGEFEDVDTLAEQFPKVLDDVMKSFSHIKLEDTYECAIEITRVLSTLDQGKFEQEYKEVLQLWEAISPHPSLKSSRDKYLWLNAIYEIYLEEFRRIDFDAEIYAQKTRKLIEESSKLLDFKGHLPAINIDSNYLDKLKDSKLNPHDKAEKIIRDIETVIRVNESGSPIYIAFQERLDALIESKKNENEAIEDLIDKLSALYSELDDIATLPQKMGFEDKGRFEIFTLLQNHFKDRFDEKLCKEFANELYEVAIKPKLFIGWQDIPNEIQRLTVGVEIFASQNKYMHLGIDEEEELIAQIMKIVVKNYKID